MKKLIILILSLCLVLTFTGCKDKGEEQKGEDAPVKDKYSLEQYIKNGTIPEAEFALGTNIDVIIDARSDDESGEDAGHTHTEFYHIQSERLIQDSEIMYYYNNNGKVDAIASTSEAFGFEVGDLTGKYDIIKAFPSYKYVERAVEDNELDFIYGELDNVIAITYTAGNNQLDFYFENDSLLGVSMTLAVNK